MNIAIINMTSVGSTGKIMMHTAGVARQRGHNVVTCFPAGLEKEKSEKTEERFRYGSRLERKVDNLLGRVFGHYGIISHIGTRQLIRELKKRKIELIHLHNLHSYCINFALLFKYIKKNRIKVIWTLHDCWSFTGHCPHFEVANCNKWEDGCHHCPQLREYPQSLLDNSRRQYKLKKKWFSGVENMTVVTPSDWLADYVGRSFLGNYPIKVINNGIDLSVFSPSESDWRKLNGISEKQKLILGVSFEWGYKKGLDVFIELARRLDPREYRIVLVGTNNSVDAELPDNIISIHRTNDQKELANIYSAADIFINPTREETYPTVNMEALACGTPVITFKTGGSPEMIDPSCGYTVEKDDIDGMVSAILNVDPNMKQSCLKRAEDFDMHQRFSEYLKLYES